MKFLSLVRAANVWRSQAPQVRRRSKSLPRAAAQVALLEPRQLLAGGVVATSVPIPPGGPINFAPDVQPKDFATYENSVDGAFIGTIKASDPDTTQTLTFSIESGNTNGAFAINPVTGVLSVASSAALDFEVTPKFTLTVKVTDNGVPQLSDTATVTVTMLNRNEPPTMASQSKTIQENSPKGTVVATFKATDPDAGQTVKYSVAAGNTGNAFAIDPNTGVVTVNDPKALDYETAKPWQLTIFATDSGATPLAVSAQLNVFLSEQDEGPPILPRHDFSIGENSLNNAFIGTIKANNIDTKQSHKYAITAGNINDAFAIDPDTGVLSVKNSAALDFETKSLFQLTVMATEKTAPFQSGSGVVNVFLRDVNETPSITGPKNVVLSENSAVGTVVATVNTADPDAGQTFTYAITEGNEEGAFAINPTTGVITVANSTPLDWENQPPFNLKISVTDSGTPALSSTSTLTIALKNANDAPHLYDATVNLAENSAVGTTVLDYKVIAKDQDAGQTLSYAITAGNSKGAFAINPVTGIITVKDSAPLDFETNPTFTITISVTDNGSPALTSSKKLTIKLTNVNESPVIVNQSFGVKTGVVAGTIVGTVKSTDPDAGQSRVYSIESGNGTFNGAFAINPTTGVITVKSALRTLFPGTFNLVVRVTDNGNPAKFAEATVTVHVNATGTVPKLPTDLLPPKARWK